MLTSSTAHSRGLGGRESRVNAWVTFSQGRSDGSPSTSRTASSGFSFTGCWTLSPMSRLHLDSHSGTRLPLAYFCYICVPDSFTWISSVSPRTPPPRPPGQRPSFPHPQCGDVPQPLTSRQATRSPRRPWAERILSLLHGQRLYWGKRPEHFLLFPGPEKGDR